MISMLTKVTVSEKAAVISERLACVCCGRESGESQSTQTLMTSSRLQKMTATMTKFPIKAMKRSGISELNMLFICLTSFQLLWQRDAIFTSSPHLLFIFFIIARFLFWSILPNSLHRSTTLMDVTSLKWCVQQPFGGKPESEAKKFSYVKFCY